VTRGMARVDESRKLVVQYEDFCRDPEQVFTQLVRKLGLSDNEYNGTAQFKVTRSDDLPERAAIQSALAVFEGQ